MNTLVYGNGVSAVEKNNKRLISSIKPEFSFEYDEIQFHESNKGYVLNHNFINMTEAQEAEVVAYIDSVVEDEVTGAKIRTNTENLVYLAQTDWMVVRASETGTPVPEEVLQKRAEARLAIVEIT